jgi:glyoxylase I family protein
MIVFHHVALNCRDLERQEAFYREHLGFKRARVFRGGRPDAFVMLRLGNTCLELFTASPEHTGSGGGEQPVGFKHMAFEVNDLDGAVAHLEAAGVRTEAILDLSGFAQGLRVCFFHDPEGNRLELMEGYTE